MSTSGPEVTPVGQRPSTGGWVKQYPDAAERARAWRARRKARQGEAASEAPPTTPALAEASLAVTLDRLKELLSAHQSAVESEVARVEDAIAALSDPEAVADELATARAETARQLAEAQ